MDFKCVCIIIGVTIKKIKNKFILDGGPMYRGKTVRD